MNTSSEYTFPIFISSTDYNLKDLRAELARFLTELGYKPILSSAEGFPDNSPILEPWESCIPVLDKSFVVVLIIDGDYSQALKWPNFSEHFGDRKISPTHGEYVYAHKFKKRMLVFIRKSLMPHYQSYRATMTNVGNDREKAKKALAVTLPKTVSFETLEFINEVKTTRPIPWINEFDDITSVKKEIQKKMLNELAEIFLIKNKHTETVVESFNTVMDSLSKDEQKKALSKINATKGIMEAFENNVELEKELQDAMKELEENKSATKTDQTKTKKKISELESKIANLQKSTYYSPESQFFLKDGSLNIKPLSSHDYLVSGSSGLTDISTFIDTSPFLMKEKCDRCGYEESMMSPSFTGTMYGPFKRCQTCKKRQCHSCWPPSLVANEEQCPACKTTASLSISSGKK